MQETLPSVHLKIGTGLYAAVSAILILSALVIGYLFAVSDKLSGFSDDSATYFIMSEVFSPYSDNTPESFTKSYEDNWHLPPGLPIVMAITGVSGSIHATHILIVIEFALLLIASSIYYRIITKNNLAAIACLFLLISMPGIWLRLLEIMSEMQYTLLSICILIYYSKKKHLLDDVPGNLVIVGTAISFLVLTRSIGIAMLLALFAWSVSSIRLNRTTAYSIICFLLGLLAPLMVWSLFKPSGSTYNSDLMSVFSEHDFVSVILLLAKVNFLSLIDAWNTNTILFWNYSSLIKFASSLILLSISLAGLASRYRKLDAIYVFLYLGVLLVWPYPYDMPRFIFPLLPILVVYLYVGSQLIVNIMRLNKGFVYVIIIFALSTTSVSLAYIKSRHDIASSHQDGDLSHISMVYFKTNTEESITIAKVWDNYFYILRSLPTLVAKDSKILATKSQFVTYLSGIYCEKLPPYRSKKDEDQFLKEISESDADYVLLTDIPLPANPYGTALLPVFKNIAETSMYYKHPGTDSVSLVLLKINKTMVKEFIAPHNPT